VAHVKKKVLEALYHTSTFPHGQDEEQIKRHLVHCLEMRDGDRGILPLCAAERGGGRCGRAGAGVTAACTDLCIPRSGMSG
jgi:hypothetical protein